MLRFERSSNEPDARLAYIDALRGVAILGVLITHAGLAIDNLPEALHSFVSFAARGVELFFVLSAVTLLSVYGNRGVSEKEFFIRRFFRIAPMFYLGAAFYQLAQFLSLGTTASAVDIVSTLLFIHVWEPHNINNVVPGCWSIGNEAMFYILFPILSRNLKSIRQTIIAVALSFGIAFAFKGLIPAIFPDIDQNSARDFWKWGFPAILPAFMCGFLVFRLINAETIWLRLPPKWFSLFVLVSFFITAACYQSVKIFRSFWFDDLLLTVVVLAVASHQPRLIVNRAIQSVGRVSYSIYLVHFGVLSYVKPLVVNHFSQYSPYIHIVLLVFLVLVPSYLISCVTFAQIERPMIRFGRYVSTLHERSRQP